MPGFEPTTRARNLERLAGAPFEVLIIGGGITGAGVAREAANQGLEVALVEARDFASGTSGRSSKLIHGGLRYLEQGDIALVREAAAERKRLRRMAPHLTTPAPMLIPVYGRTGAGLYKLRLGLTIYEKLADVAREERHSVLSREEALAAEPRLAPDRLQGAALYPEYATDDARLVLDTLKSAQHAGAATVNYLRVVALGPAGRIRTVELRDGESGAAFTARARVIVNAAGPWVDAVGRLEGPSARPRLHLTKGIHLVFRADDLPVRHCVVMRARDGRPVFTVARGPHVYVGTTDTSYEGPLEEPTVAAGDASYLLEAVSRSFVGLDVGPRGVVGQWAGLRPLVREPGKAPSEISRKDEVTVTATGVVTVAGGKLTTYRRMAERVLAVVAPLVGRTVARSEAALRPIAGGDLGDAPDIAAYARSYTVQAGMESVPPETAARLIATYGSDALAAARAAIEPSELRPLTPGVPLCAAEVRYAARSEMARTLADVLERRSRLALFETAAALAVAPAAARILAGELGWDTCRHDAELASFARLAAARLAWRDGGGTGS